MEVSRISFYTLMGFPWFSKKSVHVSDLFNAVLVIDFPFFFTSLQD